MQVSDAIRTMRAVRQFAAREVPAETIRAIVNAGRRAQSSKNTQPWSFIVVRERERLQKLAAVGPFAGHLQGAAFGVAFVSPDPSTRWSIPFDLGQAVAYMQLAAWARGIGSCIGAIYEQEQAKALLQVPADLHFKVALSFGYPAEDLQRKPLKQGGRRAFEEVVHWEKWEHGSE